MRETKSLLAGRLIYIPIKRSWIVFQKMGINLIHLPILEQLSLFWFVQQFCALRKKSYRVLLSNVFRWNSNSTILWES